MQDRTEKILTLFDTARRFENERIFGVYPSVLVSCSFGRVIIGNFHKKDCEKFFLLLRLGSFFCFFYFDSSFHGKSRGKMKN